MSHGLKACLLIACILLSAANAGAQTLNCEAQNDGGYCDQWPAGAITPSMTVVLRKPGSASMCRKATLFVDGTKVSEASPLTPAADNNSVTAMLQVAANKPGLVRIEFDCTSHAVALDFAAPPLRHVGSNLVSGFTLRTGRSYAIPMAATAIPASCPAPEVHTAGDVASCQLRYIAEDKGIAVCNFTADAAGVELVLYCGGSPVHTETYGHTQAIASQRNAPAGVAVSGSTRLASTQLPANVWLKILNDLQLPVAGHRFGNYYDRKSDLAVVFINAEGYPYFPDLDVIDENDDLFAVVVDLTENMKGVAVDVSGCARAPLYRVYRPSGTTASGSTPPRVLEQPAVWTSIVRPIGKCAGSNAGVSVAVSKGDATRTTTIPVNPLYNFAVGVALGYDATLERRFDVRTPAGDTVPRVVESEDRIGLSGLFVVSFYPTPRDFQKRDFFLPERIKLFIGLDVEDLDGGLVAGAGYELLPGFDALVGWRLLTRQPVLAEGSGLENLSRFDGDPDDLPTRERWEIGLPFFGVGLTTNLLQELAPR